MGKQDTKLNRNTHSVQPDKPVPATKKLKQPKKAKDNSYVDSLLQIWSEEYLLARGLTYVPVVGKDRHGISSLLALFKAQQPDLDSQGMVEYFRTWVKSALAINDKFLINNSNPMFFYSQINKINLLLNGRSKKSYSSVGQADTSQANYDSPL